MDVIAHETSEQLSRALGDAVVRIWGRLPPDLQNRLFKEAVTSQDEKLRPRLAVFGNFCDCVAGMEDSNRQMSF